MSEHLRVEPAALHISASQIDLSADDLRSRHNDVHSRIAAAQQGWIGSSASALAAKAAQWERDSAHHYEKLVQHGHHFRSAAASYLDTDGEAGSQLNDAGSRMGELGL